MDTGQSNEPPPAGKRHRPKLLPKKPSSAAASYKVEAAEDFSTPQATHRELEARLRFSLHQLGARNAHHEFEHICRNITRLRICSNVLPATGPVTSGGDQGRDFETFRTHLATQVKGATTFVGLASQGPIAFACTVQQQKIQAKIKTDIGAIARGALCKEVHYFIEADLPVAKRHALQEYARSSHQIHLEIYDGAAIAEFLREQDLFWIANEHLGIPADSYPRPPTIESWYRDLRSQWQSPPDNHLSYASFEEVKRAIRSLNTHPDRRPDVEFWMACLERFRSHPHRALVSMATYEVAVASLRIKGSLIGLEDDIRRYFDYTKESDDTARLLDCACLVSYASTATRQHLTTITTQELSSVRSALRVKVQELLQASSDISQKCILLDLSAFIELVPDLETQTPTNVQAAFAAWKKLLTVVDRAPLFPLQEFANRLAEWVVFFVDYKEYESLIAQADDFLAQRIGRASVARNRMTRAKALSEAGRYIQAIHELNRAKAEWFSDETLYMTLGCLILAARHYSTLGMTYAAKYYALAASYIALNHNNPEIKVFVSRGIAMAAERDYEAGSWLQALSLYRKAQIAHSNFSTTDLAPDDSDRRRILLYGSIILGCARKQHTALRDAAEGLVSDWPDQDIITTQATLAEEMFAKEAIKTDGPNAQVFYRPPFSDCIDDQTIEWSGLGLRWELKWTRGKSANIAAEQFAAIAQILTCELARTDVYLLPAKVTVHLRVDESVSMVRMEQVPSNRESSWSLTVPATLTAERQLEDMAAAVIVFQELSLKPSDRAILDTVGVSGFQNALAGNLYAKVISYLDESPILETAVSLDPRFSSLRLRRDAHDELSWNADIVSEYDPAAVSSKLEVRYSRGLALTKFTLPRILADQGCKNALLDLKAAGWLDWQLIGAIAAIAQSWRAFSGGLPASYEAVQERARLLAFKEESADWDPVPLSEFTRERLEVQLGANMINTIQGVGLTSRSRTPDFGAIKIFVKSKLRYFDDDISHADPFET